MAKTITLTLPDGYEDTTHLVLVAPSETAAPSAAHPAGRVTEYAVTVVTAEGVEVEDIGCDRSLGGLFRDAARAIRTGTAVVSR